MSRHLFLLWLSTAPILTPLEPTQTQTSFTAYSPKNDDFEFDDKADDFEQMLWMLEDSNLFDEVNNQILQQRIHEVQYFVGAIKTESI